MAGELGRPDSAVRLFQRALAMLPADTTDATLSLMRARVLASFSYYEVERGRLDAGLELLAEATAAGSHSGDPSLQGLLHLQRGSILVRRGRVVEGAAQLDTALGLLGEDPEYQCRTLLNRGALHLYWANLPAAEADLRQCMTLAAQMGLAILQAKARANLAYLAYLRGDLPTALRELDLVLSDQVLPTGAPARSIVVAGRAEILHAAGLAKEAELDLDVAVAAFRRARLTYHLASAELARAQVALSDGRYGEASRWAAIARRMFLRGGNAAWAQLAELLRLQAQLRRGRRLAEVATSAQELAERLRASQLIEDSRVASLVAAQALLALRQPDRAAAVAVQAGRLRSGDRIGTRMQARLVRSELAGARGDRRGRDTELRGGLDDLHRYQARFGSLDLRTASALHGWRLAELGLADAVSDGRPEVVFAWSERARALAARLPPVRPPDDPHAAELLADLRGVRNSLRQAELFGQQLPELRRRRAELERQVRQRAWFAVGEAEIASPVRLSAVRAVMAGAGGCLVAYLAVADRLHALVVTARSARLIRLGQLSDVTGILLRVRADLDAAALSLVPPPVRDVVNRSLASGLAALEAALWRPLVRLSGDGPVVVVPTASLGAVPWTQLPIMRGRPLAVAPSATSWLAARARTPAGGAPVFAVGPGVPRGEGEVLAAAAEWGKAVPAADAAAGVAGGVAPVPAGGMAPEPAGGVVTVLTGADATSGRVLAAAGQARLLHVAAHGVHEPENPLFSSIQLADGPLFGYDLPRVAALPAHVVLSACDLGLAEVRPGDEALGMTSALLHGGVASVVAGVGRVGDEVASTVMVAYHAGLAAGRAPAVALADALSGLAGSAATPAPLVCFGAGW